jgi:hypothetical protein
MRRMKQKEWLENSKIRCPVCRSSDVELTGDYTVCEYESFCNKCGQTFVEVYKAVGYKLILKSAQSDFADCKTNQFELVKDYEEDRKERYGETFSDGIVFGGSKIKILEKA